MHSAPRTPHSAPRTLHAALALWRPDRRLEHLEAGGEAGPGLLPPDRGVRTARRSGQGESLVRLTDDKTLDHDDNTT